MFAEGDTGPLDSLTLDDAGRLWVAAGHGVDCYHPDGTRLSRLHLPELVSNLTTHTISRDQAKAGLDAGMLTLIDALLESYYAQQHLPGALNLIADDVDTGNPAAIVRIH